jgi:ABC-type multidrug transport system permease subunit
MKAAALVALPTLSLWRLGNGSLAFVVYAFAAMFIVAFVLLFVLLICGITPRVEWGKVKRIWFERLPRDSKRRLS